MGTVVRGDDQPITPTFKVVVVEDTPEMAASIAETLTRAHYEAHPAADAESGLALVKSLPADMVLLDVTLPGIDGLEACRRLRTFSDAYVIMLTGNSSQVDRLTGLAAGADDYVTKPFYPQELVARIKAMQRRPRSSGTGPTVRRFGDLTIDPANQRVRVAGDIVELSQIEYRLLNVLSSEASRTMTRSHLLHEVWGEERTEDDHLLDVHISNLRRKLGDDPTNPSYIRTIRGRGFSMRES
jgi:DNA-binding response OmpR family regulator